jgi:hypothetical protein
MWMLPDLCEGARLPAPAVESPPRPSDGQSRLPFRKPGNGRGRGAAMLRPVVLDPEQSAALRERLLAEIGKTASADLAASWAQEALTAKNSLTAADAKLVEDAFELRISELVASETTQRSNDASSTTKAAGSQEVRKPIAAKMLPTDQERARGSRAAALSQPGAPALCRSTALPGVRPQAVGPSPPHIHTAARSRS